jgi:hypothetical protein
MRSFTLLSLVLGTALLWICSSRAEEKPKVVNLLAGDSLDGWECFLVDSDVKKEEVWSIKEGVLICRGEPLGYLYTKEKFKNFKLTLQWRWAPGSEPGNSGVLLRITGDAISFLPKCAEAQLKSGSAGDIWGFYGFQLKGDADRLRVIKDHQQLGNFQGVGRIKGNEKEPGQWNTYEITMNEGCLNVVINGEQVNEATDCDVVAGSIGLQSEGGEIHFRKIRLVPLP